MPRDLADVLHYFIPEIDSDTPEDEAASFRHEDDQERSPAPESPAAAARASAQPDPVPCVASAPPLPALGLPIGDRDVVRAALAWNLAIETARLGAATVLVVPESDRGSPLWPDPSEQPLGCELVFSQARDLEQLERDVNEIAAKRAASTKRGGIVFVRIPPTWLESARAPSTSALRWLLLLTSAHRRDLREAHALAQRLAVSHPGADIGITIHGVSAIAEARNAFEYLYRVMQAQQNTALVSYGLLVDDLHVYRAIVAQRPIGLAHPQAPATRALMDVARLLYEDARSRVLG